MKDTTEVVIVSIDNYSWEKLMKDKFYAFPKGSRKVGEYFAFYKDGKISYYAKVKESLEGDKEDVGVGYWLYCMPDAEPPFQIVKFQWVRKLKNEIKKEEKGRGKHIQGRVYTTLKKLLNAKSISDLRKGGKNDKSV